METKETISNLVSKTGNKSYEYKGSTPGPNSVGSEEIKDEGVKMEDLERDIQDKLDAMDDENVISEEEIADEWNKALQDAGLPPLPTADTQENVLYTE